MGRDLIYHIASFVIFIALQLFVFSQLNFLEYGFCFIYLGFFLMLPYDFDRILGLLMAFGVGLLIDIFYQSGGIHTAACVLLMFMRPGLLSLLNPKSGFEAGMRITINQMGWAWYMLYSTILIFSHHFILYSLDAFSFSLILKAMLYAAVSTVFSMVMIITVQLLLFSRIKT